MATTESRTGFRLPWSADRAPSHDASEEDPEGEPRTGDFELPAPEMEPAGALEPTADADVDVDVAEAVAPDPGDGPVAPGIADSAPARRPTKFLIDLTHAMQVAAEQARAATLEQFRVEGSTYVEQIQGRSIADADALRRRADEDVASIKDWSKAEIARIREESENRMAGRRGQLDGQLGRHAALVECDVTRIQGQIASFEAEMAAFFDELLTETDLTILAARAQQMPEAPAFDEMDDTAFTALMTEPAVGIPIAEAEPIAEPEPIAEMPTTALEAEGVTVADTAPAATPPPTGDLSFDRDAAMAAIQAAAWIAAIAASRSNERSPVGGGVAAGAVSATVTPSASRAVVGISAIGSGSAIGSASAIGIPTAGSVMSAVNAVSSISSKAGASGIC